MNDQTATLDVATMRRDALAATSVDSYPAVLATLDVVECHLIAATPPLPASSPLTSWARTDTPRSRPGGRA